jgi:hypothetical protein
LAFGDDGTAVSLGDERLVNEVYRDPIDDYIDNSIKMDNAAVLLIGSDPTVDLNLQETALVSEAAPGNNDDIAANRAPFDVPDDRLNAKESKYVVAVWIKLPYLENSEVI